MKCRTCKEEKDPSEFYRNHTECKPCNIERATRWNAANPERVRAIREARKDKASAQKREWHATVKDDPVFKERARQRSKAWRDANQERHRANSTRYAAENPDRVQKYHQEYYEAHKDQHREARRRWKESNRDRVRRLAREDRLRRYLARDGEAFAYALILKRDPCSYCGCFPAGVVEHIIPLSKGGPNAPDNLTASCGRCNARKRSKPLLRFLWEIGREGGEAAVVVEK